MTRLFLRFYAIELTGALGIQFPPNMTKTGKAMMIPVIPMIPMINDIRDALLELR